ncbi:Phosphoenolpyruvate-protein phosphotransferase [uncultured Desulfobacterium sp.]|uniref:Phosphoenolpyruvate-protein phosphotransferase n=1 Tax=uncultured Desulfobacterium sp. TaxID=201089 RepID=A0A445MXN4_9BACT|nr:Phosphoenolpyruvate-protein phosphotransferase [uncultured Desulfobacterium sp.]
MRYNNNYAPKLLKGIGVSPGIIIGKAHLVDSSRVRVRYKYVRTEAEVAEEVEKFRGALLKTEQQLNILKNQMPDQVREHEFMLDSHLMILKDSMLTDATVKKIQNEKINAEWALTKSLKEVKQIFEQIDDEYIGSRIRDVQNVTERVLRNLSGKEPPHLSDINERVIIVAHDLSPADTAELNISRVMGFVTDAGGRTSHTGILAHALQIPAVVGLESVSEMVEDGDLLIVDGTTGEVVINPEDSDIIYYQEKQLQHEAYISGVSKTSHLPAITIDGHRLAVLANIEFLEEVTAVRDYGGEGIGLYRTEFLYLRSKELPTEEELFENYREVAEIIAPKPVTIRSLDLGGDKVPADFDIKKEANPALGLRAIRFCLKEPHVLKTQLRAILRASVYGEVQLMFPMVSDVEEVLVAKEILNQAKSELDREGVAYDCDLRVGIMVEVPSAVTIAEVLARHVEFFSIGTNDLIQYALAIDRDNEHVAYLFQPFHPAILRMIHQVVKAAKQAGIPVSICGEMAGDPLCIPFLVGLGLDQLSMNARAIPLIKNLIRLISLEEARTDVENMMRFETADEVKAYAMERAMILVPEFGEKGRQQEILLR